VVGLLASLAVSNARAWADPPEDPNQPSNAIPLAAFDTGIPSTQHLARELMASTVTVRVQLPEPAAPVLPANDETGQPAAPPRNAQAEVRVSSGVLLGEGRLVTFVNAPAGSNIRVTLPDGSSVPAELRVVDRYSGLSLLRVGETDLPGMVLATAPPDPGMRLLTAAASGMEAPLLSLGILGGTDRIVGAWLPPLLQCDLRTTASSCGAAILDLNGRVRGIIVATESGAERNGWTYAVPAFHVQRLMKAESDPDVRGVVVLERRRPELGLSLAPGDEAGSVIVERVRAEGPASQAGLMPGDQVLSADHRPIRSVYQAVVLVLRKQPGDVVAMTVRRGVLVQNVEITLGNAGPAEPVERAANPQLGLGRSQSVRSTGAGQVEVRETVLGPEESTVAVTEEPEAQLVPRETLRLMTEESRMLREAIGSFRSELERRDAEIEKLRQQLERLEKQVAE
jgi:S1-C subfamily serine protease